MLPLHNVCRYESLLATGDESVANARLLDLIRQVRLGSAGRTDSADLRVWRWRGLVRRML